MTNTPQSSNCCCCSYPWIGYLFFLAVLVGTFVLGMMIVSVNERRAESTKRSVLFEVGPEEMDAAKWGRSFPRQYETWQDTQYRGGVRGANYTGNPPTYLAGTPEFIVMFAGLGFSKEYNQARGHWHSITDVTKTARITDTSPASCWECKSPDAVRLINQMGREAFNAKTFHELKDQVKHSISCYDCHDETTLALRSLRPAVLEGFKNVGQDMNALTYQEKRSAVCAQCHSTYHLAEGTNVVTFPWSKESPESPWESGLTAERIEEYYKETNFSDWTNPISGVRMIKIRHADYELYTASTHYARNVSCADCHLPYKTEGAEKFSDHHIRSPLADVAGTCAVCHRWSEDDSKKMVRLVQQKVKDAQDRGKTMLARAHFDIAACMEAGATDDELKSVREELRYAQMHWDFIASANGKGFHAPQESNRILTTALDRAAGVRIACAKILAKHGYTDEVVYPNYSSRSRADAVVKQFVEGERPSLLKK